LKNAEVKPYFKTGDKKDICNYRALSLFTAFSKVSEKVIYATLYQHLNNYNILLNEHVFCGTRGSFNNLIKSYLTDR
jgi:fructose-1,6-bisphosphatase/inositol monophosphatase family enzyme